MPRVWVFDTNVLISANLKPKSVPRQAYDKALAEGTLMRSAQTLEEFVRKIVLPKFDKYLNSSAKAHAIAEYQASSVAILVTSTVHASQDEDDNMFLDLALAANADCIVTGDPHLLTLHPLPTGQAGFQGIPILSPADFLKLF